jgi:hypothetical protein
MPHTILYNHTVEMFIVLPSQWWSIVNLSLTKQFHALEVREGYYFEVLKMK